MEITYTGAGGDFGRPLNQLPNVKKEWASICSLKTPRAAATRLHRALLKDAEAMGWAYPEEEIFLMDPDKSASVGCGREWRVMWESGPSEWAVVLSLNPQSNHWFTEPYYSFDVGFVTGD